MNMNPFIVLNYQTVLSFVALTLIIRWYILPRLSRLPLEEALIPLIWIHVFSLCRPHRVLARTSVAQCTKRCHLHGHIR